VQARHGTLVAATVTTVTLGTAKADSEQVEVLNRDGAAEIYFTVDGTTPTVAGDDTEMLPASIGSVRVIASTSGQAVVKLISSGTPKYTVRVSRVDQ
jgi:hypothetical protein